MVTRKRIDRLVEVDAGESRSIGFLSDSHGPIDPRIAAAVAACDCVVHAGDVGGPEVLADAGVAGILAVRGNNDTTKHWGPADCALPDVLRLRVFNGIMIVVHGHQFPNAKRRHEQLRARYADAVAIVYGHSHRFCIDDGIAPWVLNPGACGRARSFGGPSAVLLTRVRQHWRPERLHFEPVVKGR
jgi:hypothetical protein